MIVEELEKLAKETEFAAGYVRVRTPHLAREKMYVTSGHLPYYAESMFPPMELSEALDTEAPDTQADRYYLKAMNCPHHHRIFAAEPRSYRELPLRLAEYGCCYRYEQSGELFGLMRVRSMNMNDAHIYCTAEQFADEFRAVNEMYLNTSRFSASTNTACASPRTIPRSSAEVRGRARALGEDRGHGAPGARGQRHRLHRGAERGRLLRPEDRRAGVERHRPRIHHRDEPVDFAVPARFGLTYRDRDNLEKTPLCIHRAPLGTHERFIGFLIEHYAGNFPLWLAPDQVRIITIGTEEPLVEYAKSSRPNSARRKCAAASTWARTT